MPRTRHATIVAYLALFVALGGSAYAVGSNSDSAQGVIRACYSNRTGALSVLRGSRCGRGERELIWNEQGVAGATGPQGATGATGTVDTSNFYTKPQSDARYAPATLFGGGVTPGNPSAADGTCILGEIKLSAVPIDLATNWMLAKGQLLPISTYGTLYNLLGTTYGGNGQTNFALPNLQAADPRGTGSVAPAYVICTSGNFP